MGRRDRLYVCTPNSIYFLFVLIVYLFPIFSFFSASTTIRNGDFLGIAFLWVVFAISEVVPSSSYRCAFGNVWRKEEEKEMEGDDTSTTSYPLG